MRRLTVLLLVILTISSCRRIEVKQQSQENVSEALSSQEYLLAATVWQQQSAEYTALCHQAYNMAKEIFMASLQKNESDKPLAIIVDVDETVLDNSPFEATSILENRSYSSEFWKEWTNMGIAKPVPGALEFLRFADEYGAEIFYVSNRKVHEIDSTMKNLLSYNFPDLNPNHFLFKDSVSTKKHRRAVINEKYNVVLLIGDNLDDFSEIFENRAIDNGKSTVEEFKSYFGKKFIILPNPMYGSWSNELVKGTKSKTEVLKESLVPFR